MASLENFFSSFSLSNSWIVFVLPSTLETPGLAALEAAALGIPIIITSEGCTKEYFGSIETYYDGKKGDIMELAKLIDKIFINPSLGIVNFDQIKKFSWDKCIDNQILIYEELL